MHGHDVYEALYLNYGVHAPPPPESGDQALKWGSYGYTEKM